jgi:hypothetical protein
MTSERQIRRASAKEREDVLAAGYAPKEVRKFLAKLGGLNPYGEASYRMVLAQHVLIYRGNHWTDWPENSNLEDQGGLVFSEETKMVDTVVKTPAGIQKITAEVPAETYVSRVRPLREVDEMRWIPRYPHLSGWILQHWDPPSAYGSKEEWEKHTVKGRPDLLLLGNFPSKGDYEISAEWIEKSGAVAQCAFEKVPPFDWLERAIAQREYNRNQLVSANKDWRMLVRMHEFRNQQEKEARKRREMLEMKIREKIKPIFASSLEAGRIREQLAARARERGVVMGHVGN